MHFCINCLSENYACASTLSAVRSVDFEHSVLTRIRLTTLFWCSIRARSGCLPDWIFAHRLHFTHGAVIKHTLYNVNHGHTNLLSGKHLLLNCTTVY